MEDQSIVKSEILLLWLLFAVWCYLLVVYFVGSIWIFQKPKGKTYLSKSILSFVIGLILLNGLVQGAMIYFYIAEAKSVFSDDTYSLKEPAILHSILAVSLILTISQLLCFFFLTNNLIVQVRPEQLSLLGLTVYFSSITGMSYSKSKRYWIIKYVYKQEKSMIWQEKIRFFAKFKMTRLLQKELTKLIDVKKNRALFDIVEPKKSPSTKSKIKVKKTKSIL